MAFGFSCRLCVLCGLWDAQRVRWFSRWEAESKHPPLKSSLALRLQYPSSSQGWSSSTPEPAQMLSLSIAPTGCSQTHCAGSPGSRDQSCRSDPLCLPLARFGTDHGASGYISGEIAQASSCPKAGNGSYSFGQQWFSKPHNLLYKDTPPEPGTKS